MKNSELISILRKARQPEPPGEFWEEFPQQVTRQLNRSRGESRQLKTNWFPRLAWGFAAAVCVLVAFALGHWRGRMETKTAVSNDILQNAKVIRETLAMFPNRVRAIVCDQSGFNLILSEHSDVPDSTPIYIRVCSGNQCSSFVTFSGQEIPLAGQKVTVLSDAHGGIILAGNHFLWSSSERMAMNNGLEIEAKDLGRL